MPKTANVFSRVEPQIKEEAEQILDQLGLSMSSAVELFLR
ncbi:MAG: type II toxin-antitoxin system RelB/DinJ family antitoxin, partial [Clostridia bacterium]|nr:type II toxin-antitoxin system RelB/DinJ family antitoxin [Clostridia bacterium]